MALSLGALLLLFGVVEPVSTLPGPTDRTVIDLEYGQYYGYAPVVKARTADTPAGQALVGIAILQPHNTYFRSMRPDALKAPHGHFQHFAPRDPGDDFPYAELKALEAKETTAGRPPIFVTATYRGKKRPVYFEWHLALNSSWRPTANPSRWSQAVNLRDDRFIRFYINTYLRKTLWRPRYPNYWHMVDNCSFRYDNYGVLDDHRVYTNRIRWDPPFAQDEADFLESVKYFLKRVKELAPDVHILGNEGSLRDESRFPDVWSGFDGTVREEINAGFQPTAYFRDEVYKFYKRYAWEAKAGKVAVLRSLLPPRSHPQFRKLLRTGYITYIIFRGPNFFYAPRFDEAAVRGVPAEYYAAMRDALGLPVAPPGDRQAFGAAHAGYRLYWRRCEGGIVYLNWTGTAQEVPLPAGQSFYDHNGRPITSLTIPDLRGDYALLSPGGRAQTPAINPRYSGVVGGGIQVTLSGAAGSKIYYTLDGATPSTGSTLYKGPFTLKNSATVRARAFSQGQLESFVAGNTYLISSEAPLVQFHSSQEAGPAFASPPYALLELSRPRGNAEERLAVSYRISVAESHTGREHWVSGGKVIFAPGERYRDVPIDIPPVSAPGDRTIRMVLSDPQGAVLGPNHSYVYKVLDDFTVCAAATIH